VRRYFDSLELERREIAQSQLVRETCKYEAELCLTLLAQWEYRAPTSAERSSLLIELVETAEFGEQLDAETLEFVSHLYDAESDWDIAVGYEHARKVRRNFVQLYHHSAPFSAEALRGAWRDCSRDPRCSIEMEDVRRLGVPPQAQLNSQ
jgi:hypothetical protein